MIEKQVTSLRYSKKLKELGVKQESLYAWYRKGEHYCLDDKVKAEKPFIEKNTGDNVDFPYEFLGSAFTVAELGEMLPSQIKVEREYLNLMITKWSNGKFGIGYSREDKYNDTEASARAKMLIYLIENDLLKQGRLGK